jgi:hypothetical protein
VRGPRHIVRRGKTPVLDPAEARQLIDAINTSTIIGLRDRALIGLKVYSFARIGAAIGMRVEDVYQQNRRLWVRLHDKGGKAARHAVPSQSRNLLAGRSRRRGPYERSEGISLSDLQPRDRPAHRRSPAPSKRLCDDSAAHQFRRHHHAPALRRIFEVFRRLFVVIPAASPWSSYRSEFLRENVGIILRRFCVRSVRRRSGSGGIAMVDNDHPTPRIHPSTCATARSGVESHGLRNAASLPSRSARRIQAAAEYASCWSPLRSSRAKLRLHSDE